MSRCLSAALRRINVLHGLTDAHVAELGEVSDDTIFRARHDHGDTGADGIFRASRGLAARHGIYDIALCALPDGYRVVAPDASGATTNGSMDDDWAQAAACFGAARAAFESRDYDAADRALDDLERELRDMRAEIARKRTS